jgi:hypothetical protein
MGYCDRTLTRRASSRPEGQTSESLGKTAHQERQMRTLSGTAEWSSPAGRSRHLGWRAVFVDETDHTSHYTVPLVGWSLFRITVRDKDTGDQLPQARTRIEGVVAESPESPGALVSVFEYDLGLDTRFWWYLNPDDPDPEPGKVPVIGQEPDGKGKGDRTNDGKTNGGKGGRGRGRGRASV